jgi:hypothetical protein
MTSSSDLNLVSLLPTVGQAIQLFYNSRVNCYPFFHADDLRVFVETAIGKSAPASADRILRDLRKAGKINYVVTDRSKSLYKLLPITPAVETAVAA